MSTLESVVLPLKESQSLAAAGITLDTALVWVEYSTATYSEWHVRERQRETSTTLAGAVSAPTLSELLDAIRAKADAIEERMNRGMELERHEEEEQILYELVGQGHGNCEDDWQQAVGKGSTDLLAACALLQEVSHA